MPSPIIRPFLKRPLDKWIVTQLFADSPAIYKQFGLPGHNGIDLRTRFIDSPLGHRYVLCAAEGKVETVRFDKGGYGYHIRVRHGNGALTLYGHCKTIYAKEGDIVRQGQRIALTDNTGFSTGPHLHFEVRIPGHEKNGYYGACNPLEYLLNS